MYLTGRGDSDSWQSKLSELNSAMNAKADETWLKTLEAQIRAEMEGLRKSGGGGGISAKALEAKLQVGVTLCPVLCLHCT